MQTSQQWAKKVRETCTGRNPENFGECFVSHSNGSSFILRRHHYHQGWNRTSSLDQITCITSEKKKSRVWYGICATQHYFRKSSPTVIWSFGGQKLYYRFDIILTKTWPKNIEKGLSELKTNHPQNPITNRIFWNIILLFLSCRIRTMWRQPNLLRS